MFESIVELSFVKISITPTINSISLHGAVLPHTFITIPICKGDFASILWFVVAELPFVLKLGTLFVNTLPLFQAQLETTIILATGELLVSLTMGYIGLPLPLISVVFVLIDKDPVAVGLAI